jgi:hypothetical protein
MAISSNTLKQYKDFLATESKEKIEFVDQVYSLCEKNYENGGDIVVESFTPPEILDEFKTLKDVKKFCGVKIEHALNFRLGEDDDPQLKDYDNFKEKWLD